MNTCKNGIKYMNSPHVACALLWDKSGPGSRCGCPFLYGLIETRSNIPMPYPAFAQWMCAKYEQEADADE